MSVQVPLCGRGGVIRGYAVVDDEDAERVLARRWFLNHHGYVWCWGPGREFVSLHRLVMGCEQGDGRHVDHKNHDKLDNRRSNLRVGTRSLNQQNRRRGYGSSSFRGVCWDKRNGKWKAYATVDRKQRDLGSFDDELEAALVAAQWRAKHMPFSSEASKEMTG